MKQMYGSATNPVLREWYLDNLKVVLTLLVILHHAGQAYGGSWPYTPSLDEQVDWLDNFFCVNAMFLMGVFFLISGYFTPGSYDRHGFKGFVRTKFLRLGVPLVVGVGVCSLVVGHVEFAHLWFVAHLLLFSFVYALWRLLSPKRVPTPGHLSIWLLILSVVGLAAINSLTAADFPPVWRYIGGFLWGETTHLPLYILLFLAGVAAFRGRWFDKIGRTTGLLVLAVGVTLAMLVYLRLYLGAFVPFLDANMWWYDPLLGVFLAFGLVALFRFCFSGTSKCMQWLAAHSYAAYLLHIFVILGLQSLFDQVRMGGGAGKFFFICIASSAGSYFAAYLLRLIPGVRRFV